jgi:hypothetical protein
VCVCVCVWHDVCVEGGRESLLSTDKQALTTARRFGLSFSHPQPQPPSRSPAGSGAVPPRPPVADAAPASTTKNARQRRSAERSARRGRRHAARRAQLCTRSILSLLFIVRLRRMVDGTLGVDHEVSSVLAKRRTDERPPSSSSSSRSTSSSSTPAWLVSRLPEGADPPVQHGQGRQEKRSKSGMLAGFLLRWPGCRTTSVRLPALQSLWPLCHPQECYKRASRG